MHLASLIAILVVSCPSSNTVTASRAQAGFLSTSIVGIAGPT